MFDKTLVQLHEQLTPLTRLAYHIAYKAGCTGSNKITVDNDTVQLIIAYDPLECSIRLRFNGHIEAVEIVVNRPECENTSYSFVTNSHNYTLGRFKFRSNNWDDNPYCTFTSEKNGLNFHDVKLYSTEEELFQLSTVQNAPTIELLKSLQEIHEIYDFIDKEVQFAVNFIERHELHNDEIMKPICDEAWSLLPALLRKMYVAEQK